MDGDKNNQNTEESSWQPKPGETIFPPSTSIDIPQQQSAAPRPEPIQTQPLLQNAPLEQNTAVNNQQQNSITQQVTSAPIQMQQPEMVPQTPVLQQTAPSIASNSTDLPPPSPMNEHIKWTASEFVTHHKSSSWHVMVLIIAVAAGILSWLITKDIVTTIVIIMFGAILSFYGNREPKQIQYSLSSTDISINSKQFGLSSFRAFSVIPEGALASIALIPVKRFAPMISLYFDPDDEDRILEVLGSSLPYREMKADVIDAFMRKIRF